MSRVVYVRQVMKVIAKSVIFFLVLSFFVPTLQLPDPESRFISAHVGKRFKLDYLGPEMIFQRCTSASADRQFAFRLKGFSGWTTNGTDRIEANTMRIHPNGTLEIDRFSWTDHGVYSYPERNAVCPLNVYTTLNGWIQDCEPSTYNWVLRQQQQMNELQTRARHDSGIQINRGAYNRNTRLYSADEAVFEFHPGDTVRLDFGAGHFVVQRVTDQAIEPQFIFAFPGFSGWTTNGTNRFDTTRTRLYPNGTLVIDKFCRKDVGKYSRPLDPFRPHQPPMHYLLELPGFINITSWPPKQSKKLKLEKKVGKRNSSGSD